MFYLTVAEEEKEPAYAGDNGKACKMCHKDQVAAWETWGMATAYDDLSDDAKKKTECIGCHVTGFGEDGEFIDAKKSANLLNVQCEACHGPAAAHLKNPMKEKPAAAAKDACANCHNEKYFGFKADEWKIEEALESIKHWKDD